MVLKVIGTARHEWRFGLKKTHVASIAAKAVPSTTIFWLHGEQGPLCFQSDIVVQEAAAGRFDAGIAALQSRFIALKPGVLQADPARTNGLEPHVGALEDAVFDQVGRLIPKGCMHHGVVYISRTGPPNFVVGKPA